MKKLISVVSVLVICMSLCACGKSEAVVSTESLIAAIGEVSADSKSAISVAEEAYNALTEEEKAKVKNFPVLAEARERFKTARVLDEWILLDDPEYHYTFNEDGSVKHDFLLTEVGFEHTENGIVLNEKFGTYESESSFVYAEKNGVEYLIEDAGDAVMVKAKYATATEHVISVENWQNYFVIEEVFDYLMPMLDVYETRHMHLLKLKDEFVDRLVLVDEDASPAVNVEAEYTVKYFRFELNDGEIKLVGDPLLAPEDKNQIYTIKQSSLCSCYYDELTEVKKDDLLSIGCGIGVMMPGSKPYAEYHDNYTINDVTGSLLLYDRPLHKTK